MHRPRPLRPVEAGAVSRGLTVAFPGGECLSVAFVVRLRRVRRHRRSFKRIGRRLRGATSVVRRYAFPQRLVVPWIGLALVPHSVPHLIGRWNQLVAPFIWFGPAVIPAGLCNILGDPWQRSISSWLRHSRMTQPNGAIRSLPALRPNWLADHTR